MKKLTKGAIAISLCVASAFPMFACENAGTNNDTVQVGEATAYVSLSINPDVEFVTDADGNVASVRAVNEDASVVLSGMDLAGKTLDEAVKEVTQESEDLDYLNETNTDVSIIVSADDPSVAEKVENLAEEGVTEGSDIAEIKPDEQALTLTQEVENYKTQDPELYKDLTVAKLKLAKSIMEYDSTFTVAQAAASTTRQLVRLLHDYIREYRWAQTEALKDKYQALYEEQSKVIYEQIDAIYGEVYVATRDQLEALNALCSKFVEELYSNAVSPDMDKHHFHFTWNALTEEMKAELTALVGDQEMNTLHDVQRYMFELRRTLEEIKDTVEDDETKEQALEELEDQLDALKESIYEQLKSDFDAVKDLYRQKKEARRRGEHKHHVTEA